MPVRPGQDSRSIERVALLAALLSATAFVALILHSVIFPSIGGYAPAPPEGCLISTRFEEAVPNEVIRVYARVTYSECDLLIDGEDYERMMSEYIGEQRALGRADLPGEDLLYIRDRLDLIHDSRLRDLYLEARKSILVGGTAKVDLGSPLFKGRIEPLANVNQPVLRDGSEGRWEWEVQPSEPGDFSLPLTVTLLDSDGNAASYTDRTDVLLRVRSNWQFFWASVGEYLTSANGFIAASVASVVGIVGLWKLVSQRRSGATKAGKSMGTAPGEANENDEIS